MGDFDNIEYKPIFERHLGNPYYSLRYSRPEKCGAKKSPKCVKEIGIDLNGNDRIDPDEKLDVNQDGRINEQDYKKFYAANAARLKAKSEVGNPYWKLVLEIESRKGCSNESAGISSLPSINDIFVRISTKQAEKRIAAIRKLGDSPTECGLPAVIAMLDDLNSDVRSAAANVLANRKGIKAVASLLEAMKGLPPHHFFLLSGYNPAIEIRVVLVKIGKPALPYLKNALSDQTFEPYIKVIKDIMAEIKNEK